MPERLGVVLGQRRFSTSIRSLPWLSTFENRMILARGRANGVEMRSMITADETRALEPRIRTIGALWSPNTGIVNAHGLMDALLHIAREAGAVLLPRSELVALERDAEGWNRRGAEA